MHACTLRKKRLRQLPRAMEARARACERYTARFLGAFSTCGLAGRPLQSMRLEVDALGDAVLNVAMIFAAAIEQHTTARRADEC